MLNAATFAFMVLRLSKLMSLCIFLKGSTKGQTGFFPASYVQVISPGDVILRCLFDFSGQEGDELTIQANQIVVQVRDEGNGWIVGKTGSVEGAFPASYVEQLRNNGPD